jgi:phthalate 3,4-dioxygenase subunit beta
MSAAMLPFGSEEHNEVFQWLVTEAEMLDERRYAEWMELLTDDVVYRMPVRVTASPHLEGTLVGMDHFDEDRYSLQRRVDRFATEHAWTEDPPSRTRHFVSNVRVYRGEHDGETLARSYLLIFRSRLDTRAPDFVVGERRDGFRRVDGALKLARREFLVDESVLRTQNLAVFV